MVLIEPISPPPLDHLANESLLAFLGNGFLGLRVGRIPLLDGLAIVSGSWGPHPMDGIPAFAPVPYPLAGDITVDGRRVSEMPDAIDFLGQRLDFATGELTSRFTFRAGEVTAAVEILTFCSRTDPALVLQELTVVCDREARVTLAAVIGTRGVPGRCVDAGLIPRGEPQTADAWLLWEGMGGATRCGIVLAAMRDDLEDEPAVRADPASGQVFAASAARATAGRPVRLRTIVGLVPDLAHPRPYRQAALLVGRGLSRGWDSLREANRRAWRELWRGSPRIDAPDDWQRLADASFFYLHSSASAASLASTGVFGLGYAPEYHYYRGHVMWDVDTFALPALVVTAPEAARALLRFRTRTMAAARANAAVHGYSGLQYPWEADFDGGFEAVPRWSKTDKDHVTLDVGLAFELYANVTGDPSFTRLEALPVVAGIAEWLLSRVEPTQRGLEIRSARGPAEAFTPVDNDAYVNLAAITFLRQAAAMLRALGDDPPGDWEAAADAIVIPTDPRSGAIVNHDGYRSGEPLGETPEAAAAFFPMGYRDRPEVEAATLRFALRHQVPRYVGTPMFSALLGVHAAWVGRRKLAAELFDRGYARFFDDPFWAPDEYEAEDARFPPASPMLANLAAFLDSLLYGLPGIVPNAADPRTWTSRRVILPSGWKSIEVERLWVRGRPARLVARHGANHATLELGERDWIGAGRATTAPRRLRVVEVDETSTLDDRAPLTTTSTGRF